MLSRVLWTLTGALVAFGLGVMWVMAIRDVVATGGFSLLLTALITALVTGIVAALTWRNGVLRANVRALRLETMMALALILLIAMCNAGLTAWFVHRRAWGFAAVSVGQAALGGLLFVHLVERLT